MSDNNAKFMRTIKIEHFFKVFGDIEFKDLEVYLTSISNIHDDKITSIHRANINTFIIRTAKIGEVTLDCKSDTMIDVIFKD